MVHMNAYVWHTVYMRFCDACMRHSGIDRCLPETEIMHINMPCSVNQFDNKWKNLDMSYIKGIFLKYFWYNILIKNGLSLAQRHYIISAGDKLDHCPYPEPVVFQWQSSGNSVCMELIPQCTLECHWRKNGSQCASSGLPVVFNCVPIMQINTGSPLGNHWVLASASVVPVASQCTCGSNGLPVCSNYAN